VVGTLPSPGMRDAGTWAGEARSVPGMYAHGWLTGWMYDNLILNA